MGVTLERVQFKFASIIGELCSEPDVLSQFAVWVDLRLAEYKLKGSISLDCSGETPDPMWLKGILSALLAKRLANQRTSGKPAGRGYPGNHGLSSPVVQSAAFHKRSSNPMKDASDSDVYPVGLHLHKSSGVSHCQQDNRKRRASETLARPEYVQEAAKIRRFVSKEADSNTVPNESLMSIISAGETSDNSATSTIIENNKSAEQIKTETDNQLPTESNQPDFTCLREQPGQSSESENNGTSSEGNRGFADTRGQQCNTKIVPTPPPSRDQPMTNKNPACAAGIFQRWLQSKANPDFRRIESIPPTELDEYLSDFFASVTKTRGGEYDHRSWRNLRSNIDRYLRELGYPHAISHSPLFQKSREVFHIRQESLKIAAALRSNSSPLGFSEPEFREAQASPMEKTGENSGAD